MRRALIRRLVTAGFALVVLMTPAAIVAQPDSRASFASVDSAALPFTPVRQSAVRLGPARVTLDASQTAIPVDGEFGYTAAVRTTRPLDFLQARLRLLMPTGRLIYQKTFIEQQVKRGNSQFSFSRSIADIGLEPGSYPVELSVRISDGATTTETVVPTKLNVFDPERERLPVVLVARVSPQPLADAEGRFVSDPAQFTRARDDVTRLAEHVLLDESARLTLSVSPMTVLEWRRIAEGYRLVTAEGETEVDAGEPVPQSYARALEVLRRAIGTGRLELLSTGLSDPSISELDAAGLVRDVRPQYRTGSAALRAALEATPSAGSAPAGGAVPVSALEALEASGIDYLVLRSSWSRAAKKTAPPGAYRLKDSPIRVLVSDDRISRTLSASSTSEFVTESFGQLQGAEGNSLPVVVTVGPQSASASQVIAASRALAEQPWARLSTAREELGDADESLPLVTIKGRSPSDEAPRDFWRTVADARAWSNALAFSMPEGSEEPPRTTTSSLIAQSSVWAGTMGDWAPSSRGLTYASSAKRTAESILQRLSLSARPVTLAGAQGEVPVTVTNDSEDDLAAVLLVEPGQSVRIGQAASTTLTLKPGENFVEVPVELVNVLTGDVRISLRSGSVELADTTVTLRASYLDRLAIVGGIVVLLGGLLAFIIMRVRGAERPRRETEN